LRQTTHRTIAGVTADLEALHFNKAVARLYEFVNALAAVDAAVPTSGARAEGLTVLVQLLAPMMPHLAEELWALMGHDTLVADAPWPAADPALLTVDEVTLAIQINGKLRETLVAPKGLAREEAERQALALPKVAKALEGLAVRKVVVVPDRIVNVVAG
jgi:leucyl-tRNA synthetase